MSLRARLVAATAVVAVVLGIVVVVVVERQERFLIGQLDKTLAGASPLIPTVSPLPLPPAGIDTTPAEPIAASDLGEAAGGLAILEYFVRVDDADGTIVYDEAGLFLDDVPDLSNLDSGDEDQARFLTVDGVESSVRFRVFVSTDATGTRVVIASPLADIDSAVDQLRWSLLAGAAFVVGILLLTLAWVHRLGIRPIARVTAAATAIGRGERDHRVEPFGPRTEAGRLAAAFNEMLDQRDAAERRLRRFVADASHELRTPLTSITGYLDLAADGTFDERRLDDAIRRMRSESQRMCDLVEDLLLLAHLDEGRPMRSDPVDIAAVLGDIASDAAVTHPDRHIEVTIEGTTLDPSVRGATGDAPGEGRGGDWPTLVVTGDDFRLRQVVAGLVQNALVHTPASATISLQARRSSDGTVVAVGDDGPGLDPAAAAVVFDRFSRQDASRSRRSSRGGFGLGLAIARAIVEAHGATIALDTAPGRGCVFTVTLPSRRPGSEPIPSLQR